MTAAHCVFDIKINLLSIHAGATCKNDILPGRTVKKIYIHDKYDPTTADNDISLLILRYPLSFNDANIQPIPMAEPGFVLSPGDPSYVSGWGLTEEGGTTTSKCLKVVEVDIVGLPECALAYINETITENMICAGKPMGGSDSCQGDSGGPLIIKVKITNEHLKKILVGVVSWGYGCGQAEFPGVYTNVAKMRNWLDPIIALYP